MEETKTSFTADVMSRINALPANNYYKPLVSYKVQRLFLIVFGSLIITIPALCLTLVLIYTQVITLVQNMHIPELNYGKILISVGIFRLLFGINAMLEKMFWQDKSLEI